MSDPREPFRARLAEMTGFDVGLDWGGELIDELIELAVDARGRQGSTRTLTRLWPIEKDARPVDVATLPPGMQCAILGHAWSRWELAQPRSMRAYYSRTCTRCTNSELQLDPPA